MRRLALIPIATFVACAESQEDRRIVECTAVYVSGLRIRAGNALTGEPIEAFTVWVRDGDFVDSLVVAGAEGQTAGERPGTYSVSVHAAGYQGWDTTGVVVTADECHVHTQDLQAMLTPAGS